MRFSIIGFLILMAVSCSETPKNNERFDLIELTICTPRNNFYSLKVFPDGKTYILIDKYNDRRLKYLLVNLSQNEIDSISILAKHILAEKLDTVYGINKEGLYIGEFFLYNLIIQKKTKKFKSFIRDGGDEIICLKNLTDYLFELVYSYNKFADSSFVYESRVSDLFTIPPPPPPISENPIKYLEPVFVDSIQY